jgi:all-trans-retinol 13,14-reductase
VLEQYKKPGGYLHSFERYGQRFDTGSHYTGSLDEGQTFKRLLEYLEVFDPEIFVPLRADGFDILQFKSATFQIPKGYDAVTTSLSHDFPLEKDGIRKYFTAVKNAVQYFPTYSFSSQTQDETNLLKILETPLQSVVESLIKDPQLKCILYAYCSLHGVAPRDASFGMHSLVTDSLLSGAYGFKNGGEYLVERFIKVIERYGGKVITGQKVTTLRTKGRQIAEVVIDDGSVLHADQIIAGIHPKAVFRLVENFNLSPAFVKRLANTEETIGIMGVYAVCKTPPPFDGRRNYYLFGFNDPTWFDRLAGQKLERREHCMLAFITRPDRTDENKDHASSYPVAFHAPAPYAWFAPWSHQIRKRKSTDYYHLKMTLARELFDFVDEFYPGTHSSIANFDVSTPLSNLRYNGSEEGSAYGIYHSIRNTGARAIGPRTHLDNLLLTGQNCVFPGILGSAVAGLKTAGNLLGIKPMLRDLSNIGLS